MFPTNRTKAWATAMSAMFVLSAMFVSVSSAEDSMQNLCVITDSYLLNMPSKASSTDCVIMGTPPPIPKLVQLPGEFEPAGHDGYFVIVFEAQYRLPGESNWRYLATRDTYNDADYALFMAYERGLILPGSEMRIVTRFRESTPPPETVTKYFVVYRLPGEAQREKGPYDTRREAEYVLFRAYERGEIPPGSSPTVQEREVPID